MSDVTCNAITTDFWANLDAVSGPEHGEMHGTGGDAKGQPTQTNSPRTAAVAVDPEHHARGGLLVGARQGSRISAPVGSKSVTLRVTTVSP